MYINSYLPSFYVPAICQIHVGYFRHRKNQQSHHTFSQPTWQMLRTLLCKSLLWSGIFCKGPQHLRAVHYRVYNNAYGELLTAVLTRIVGTYCFVYTMPFFVYKPSRQTAYMQYTPLFLMRGQAKGLGRVLFQPLVSLVFLLGKSLIVSY